MRRTLRLLASVKPARYLESGAPTGLTGLFTHPSPRATLLYLYSSTVEKLQDVPESSVYRQSVEALTRHRMAIVEGVAPPGYDEWSARAHQTLKEYPDYFYALSRKMSDGSRAAGTERGGKFFVVRDVKPDVDIREEEWDGERDEGPELEGARPEHEKRYQAKMFKDAFEGDGVAWEDEPMLTAEQIEELENKIGAGLIEEVIQVAEGELHLVNTMIDAKAWESLDEKPKEGQWVYFERKE